MMFGIWPSGCLKIMLGNKLGRHPAAAMFGFGLLFLLALYGRVLGIGFLSDDYDFLSVITRNSNPLTYFVTNIIGNRVGNSYGPIFNLLIIVQHVLFGLNAFWYHLVLIFLPAGTGTLVFLTVKKITQQPKLAVVAAILFWSWHGTISSLAWVAVLTHIAATFFFWAALYLYLNFLEQAKERQYLGALAFFAAALFTKEIVILGVGMFALLHWVVAGKKVFTFKSLARLVMRILPFVLITALYLWLRRYTTGIGAGYYGAATLVFDLHHLKDMFTQLTAHIFLPYPYRVPVAGWLFNYFWILGVALVGLLSWLYSKYRQTDLSIFKTTVFFIVSYALAIAPFLLLLVNPNNDGADRYTYFISTFFAPAVVGLLSLLIGRWRYQYWLAGIFVAVVGLQIVFGLPKQAAWIEAGKTMQGAIASAQHLPDPINTISIFVGLPDNIAGAEVSRNAIKEAIWLRTDRQFEGVREPVYTTFLPGQPHEIGLRQLGPYVYELISLNGGVNNFTGFITWSDEYGTFAVRGATRPAFLGTAIDIRLNPTKLAELRAQGKIVQFIYYSSGGLRALPINEKTSF